MLVTWRIVGDDPGSVSDRRIDYAGIAALLPLMGTLALTSFVAGPLHGRLGPRPIASLGAGFLLAGIFLLSLVKAQTTCDGLLAGMVVLGIGVGLFYSSVTTAAVTALDPSRASLAGGIVYMFQIGGGSIGLGLNTARVVVRAARRAIVRTGQSARECPSLRAPRRRMSYLWPQALWLLLAVPALVALYVVLQRRRKKAAVRYASLALVRTALTGGPRLRRHVPPLLLLLALIGLIVAIARPHAVITLPSEQRTIILAMDVSLSMRAADIQPSRMAASRDAAKAFVHDQPADVRVGIVAFAGSASLAQSPTRDREELTAAIDRLQMQTHTAIGSGLILSLATLFPDDGLESLIDTRGAAAARDRPRSASIDGPRPAEKKEVKPVPPGSYRSGAIILLTDGRRTIGPDPLEAARLAADRGVKVFTVGFGTAQGAMAEVNGYSIFMRFDEEALKSIAQLTGAEYFHAASAADLKRVYDGLNARYVLEKQETEVSALLAALAALLAVVAAALSLMWFSRIV